MKAMPRSVQIYLLLVVLTAGVSAVWLLANEGLPETSQLPLAALITACMTLAWLYSLPVGFKTHFYLDTAVLIAAVLLFEPGTAIVIVGLGTLAAQRVRRRFWDESLFNTAQAMIQAAVAALTMAVAGYEGGHVEAGEPGFVISILAAGIILYLVSAILVGTIVALQGGIHPFIVWAESILKADDSVYVGHLAQVGLAIVVAVLGDAHYWTIGLLIPPVAVVYLALDHGMELRQQAEMALRLQEKNLTEAQRLAHVGSWEWDLASGAQGWSEEAFRLLGFESPFPVPGLELLLERVHPEDREEVDRRIHAAIRYQSHFDLEHRVLSPNGKELTVHHRGEVTQNSPDSGLRVVAMIHDISERRTLETRLEHMAFHDPLTGLPNRSLLFDELDTTLERLRQGGNQFALLFVDLDGFKAINDRLGHRAGDQVLIEVGRRLAAGLRHDDIIARYGGDEFIILARSVRNASDAERLATRLIESLTSAIPLDDGKTAGAAASIGIVLPDSRLDTAGDLLHRADVALYQAKHAGKNTHAIYGVAIEQGKRG
jgi:diguanylate cyclase (GGDEF)-like protein/PAS domain S-box-containing protein